MGARLDGMRSYWDDRARKNAAWYVDTSLGYDDPDMERFFETGREIARIVLDGPVQPERKAKTPPRRSTRPASWM